MSPTPISPKCLWSEWSDWASCSAKCGPGVKSRFRKVTTPESVGGSCDGVSEDKMECTVEACSTMDEEKQSLGKEQNNQGMKIFLASLILTVIISQF